MDELISRQAAINALEKNKEMINAVLDSLTLDYNARRNLEQRRGQTNEDVETIKELPSAQPEQRWIPMTESLPKAEKKRYWVCTDTGYQCECGWTNDRFGKGEFDEWGWSIFDIPQFFKIVAYMPLPEPYRAEMEV